MKKVLVLAGGFIMGGVFAISNHMDYEDAQYEDLEYTIMVCEGYWHNYKGLKVECP